MSLKRKRSTPCISPASHTTTSTTDERDSSLSPTPISSWATHDLPPYLPSRTRKRHRDGRPDAEIIYRNTFAKLFSAQAQGRMRRGAGACFGLGEGHEHQIQQQQQQQAVRGTPGGAARQARLEALWRVEPLALSAMSVSSSELGDGLRCQDCEAPLLRGGGFDDVQMGGMGTAGEEDGFACQACGKEVCGMCAVDSVERGGRTCLECATTGRGR